MNETVRTLSGAVFKHTFLKILREVKIVPNIIMVHPPRTASGSEAKKLPIGGSKPAIIIQTAPVIIVNLFITFVMAIRPTF